MIGQDTKVNKITGKYRIENGRYEMKNVPEEGNPFSSEPAFHLPGYPK